MDWKKIGKALLCPPLWVILLLTPVSAAALVWVFLTGREEHPVAYALYMLAFYTLTVVCAWCVHALPKRYRAAKQKVYSTSLGNRYMTDASFRTHVSLFLSLGINLLYVGVNVVSFFLYRSWWFVVLAFYYGILAIMRFLLVRYVRANTLGTSLLGEWKRARLCGAILMLVNLSLSGAVLMILYENRGYEYHGIMIYVMAMYTFYMTTHAIVDMIKYRKMGSPVMTTAKIVSLSAALVSMLSLETAMFSQFGAEMSEQNQQLMIILTGAGVSIAILTLAALLITRATREIRKELR